MRSPLIPALLLGIGFSMALAASPHHASGAARGRSTIGASNPCLHGMAGHLELLEDATRFSMTSLSSASAGYRARFGLILWPRDSVQATMDSVVCAHMDSLLSVWMATPEATAKNVARGVHWPGISVVRANPHRYLVAPPIVADGFEWRFVVDSVSGHVQFYKTPF